jgi:hypothetical protein
MAMIPWKVKSVNSARPKKNKQYNYRQPNLQLTRPFYKNIKI